jgi:hypothetical protein
MPELFVMHSKKRFAIFPSTGGMSLTKLSLDGNNFNLITLIVTSRLGTGKSLTFFTVHNKELRHCSPLVRFPLHLCIYEVQKRVGVARYMGRAVGCKCQVAKFMLHIFCFESSKLQIHYWRTVMIPWQGNVSSPKNLAWTQQEWSSLMKEVALQGTHQLRGWS